jgi:hypothetical protein
MPEDDESIASSRISFDIGDVAYEDDRWSARRTLVFIMASNGVLWWVIAYALRAAI